MQHAGTCVATRKDGERCTSTIVLADGFCHMHSPARQAEVAAARVKGGRNASRVARAEKLVPSTLRPVIATLLCALEEVHRGELDPRQATAMGSLAGAVARLYSVGVLEERVAALEARSG